MAISRKRIVALFFEVAFLISSAALILNYHFIVDLYTLYNYKPNSKVASITARFAPSDLGKAIFYGADPHIDTKVKFNKDCSTSKDNLELGCYIKGKIFIMQIDNKELASEMDTVAAHEMLHAAWSRLNSGQQTDLSRQLEAFYKTLNDKDLNERLAGYAKIEPGQRSNELHSIVATEYAKLPEKLEKHYSQYFKNRQKVVAAHDKFKKVFSDQRADLAKQLNEIRNLKSDLNVVNDQLDAFKTAGEYAHYNDLVPAQNGLVDRINGLVAAYSKAVDEYNSLSKSLNSQQITQTEKNVK
jgi:hypothetical protein